MNNNKFFAFLLIISGLIWALAQFTEFGSWGIGSKLWPLFIIIPGALIMLYANSTESGSEISASGAAILATGLLLSYQSVFDHYASWAYAWTLIFPCAAGLGLLVHAKRFNENSQAILANKFIFAGAVMFLIGFMFFEIIINMSGKSPLEHGTVAYLFPAIMVISGLYILFVKQKK